MIGQGATVFIESLVASGDQSLDVAARPGIRGRDVVMVAMAWAVLTGFTMFPAVQMAVLGVSALVVSVIDIARQGS